jgi:heme/copper-type cytochrome/quinol oxidase subunit 2
VTVELMPKEVVTFEINCFTYCGRGPGRMKASSIVTPRA